MQDDAFSCVRNTEEGGIIDTSLFCSIFLQWCNFAWNSIIWSWTFFCWTNQCGQTMWKSACAFRKAKEIQSNAQRLKCMAGIWESGALGYYCTLSALLHKLIDEIYKWMKSVFGNGGETLHQAIFSILSAVVIVTRNHILIGQFEHCILSTVYEHD